MWNENEWFFPEQDPRYRPAGPWVRRPVSRFPNFYTRPLDSPPSYANADMINMNVPLYRVPRFPVELVTPHAAPSVRVLRPPPLHAPLYQDFSAPPRPLSINITTRTSALKCLIEWKPPSLQTTSYTFKLEVWEGVKCDMFDLESDVFSYQLLTIPGALYKIEISARDSEGLILALGRTKIKAVFSREEMEELYKKSLDFVGSSMHTFRFLYRCKPKLYYDDVQFRCGGIMEKYLKDNNGQAASSINGAISGLFFSARLLPDGNLPSHSPFGNIRMLVPAITLLDFNRVNMFFCDFYCNYITHYVTVVICEKGSDTDAYCSQRLIRLTPDSNPFLRAVYRPSSFEPEFWVNKNVWVEIYYTENVPLSWGRFDTIIATGAGTSRIGGLPHNKQCHICNLYPQRAGPSHAKAHSSNRANSTFELCLSLEKERLGDNIDESADIIEAVCALIDATVEQSEQVDDGISDCQSDDEKKENLLSPQHIAMQLRDKIVTGEMKEVANDLQTVVNCLDDYFVKIDNLLCNIEQSCRFSDLLFS